MAIKIQSSARYYCLRKGLREWISVSAVGISSEVCEKLERQSLPYGQSHQNDPLGAAVAREFLTVIEEEDLLKQSIEKGRYLLDQCPGYKAKYNCVKEVRELA